MAIRDILSCLSWLVKDVRCDVSVIRGHSGYLGEGADPLADVC